jgi:hypothetical protein
MYQVRLNRFGLEEIGGRSKEEEVDGEEQHLNQVATPPAITDDERPEPNRQEEGDEEHFAKLVGHYLHFDG